MWLHGWAKGADLCSVRTVENLDMRANLKVINFFQPDVVCLVETWLKGDETVGFDGYQWFGHNWSCLNKRARRGSSGVGVLVKSSICQDWLVDVVSAELEDVLWLKMQHKESMYTIFIAVCYIPPLGSSHDFDIENRFLVLEEQVHRFESEGQVVVCGDFNARCGNLCDIEGEDSIRCCVDQWSMWLMTKGRCWWTVGLGFANGQCGTNEFTCISDRGSSVHGGLLFGTCG